MKEKNFISMIMAIVLFASNTVFAAGITDDTLTLGKPGSSANKNIKFGAGTGSKPQIRYNATSSQMEFSNNGVDFLGIGSGSGGGTGINLLSEENKNPDFEVGGLANWTYSGFTPAVVTSGSNLLFGKASITATASGSGQYVQSSLVTVTYGIENAACMAQVYYKGGDANWTAKVLDASGNLIASRVMAPSTSRTAFAVPFNCGAQGSQYRVRVESTAAAALIALDRTHIGEQGLSFLSQAQLVGGTIHTTNCDWTTGNGTNMASPATPAADSDCVQSAFGGASLPATKIPAVTFPTLPAGDYFVMVTGLATYITGHNGNVNCYANLTDGTTLEGSISNYRQSGDAEGSSGTGTLMGRYSYSSTQSSVTFAVQLRRANPSSTVQTCGINPTNGRAQIFVFKIPSGQDLALTPSSAAWRVDASLYNANPNLGTSSLSSYTEITDGNLILAPLPGSATVGIPCATGTTNTAGATTCASTNESLGITFDVPRAGPVRSCVQFAHGFNVASGQSTEVVFQQIETSAASSAIIQEGGTRNMSGSSAGSSAYEARMPHTNCSIFNFDTAGTKTIRLQREQLVGASTTSNLILADNSASVGQRNIRWFVEPIGQAAPMPIMVGPFEEQRTVTTTTTIVPGDAIIHADASGGAFTATLPTAVGNKGKRITVKKTDSTTNWVTLATVSSQTIDGANTRVLYNKDHAVTLISDNANWKVHSMVFNKPVLQVYRSTGQTINSSSWTQIGYDTAEGDTESAFNTGTALYNPKVPGWYRVNCAAHITGTPSDQSINAMGIYKNGSNARQENTGFSGSQDQSARAHSLLYMNGTTDTLACWLFQNGGSAKTTSAGASLNYMGITWERF